MSENNQDPVFFFICTHMYAPSHIHTAGTSGGNTNMQDTNEVLVCGYYLGAIPPL